MAKLKKQLDKARGNSNAMKLEEDQFTEIDDMVAGFSDDLGVLLDDFRRRWFAAGGFLLCSACRTAARTEKRRRKGERDYMPLETEPETHAH